MASNQLDDRAFRRPDRSRQRALRNLWLLSGLLQNKFLIEETPHAQDFSSSDKEIRSGRETVERPGDCARPGNSCTPCKKPSPGTKRGRAGG